MTDESTTLDPDLLLDQTQWLQTLSRHLVRDPGGADDVAQETLLAALAAPPATSGDPRRLRAWLGRVAHNLAHLGARSRSRRRAREEVVARAESLESTADEVMRGSVEQLVVEAVSDLPEDYREAVELRYFEGLSVGEIARRAGASESAVRKRLWRARGRLRTRLDNRHGGERHAWFQALLPVALPGVTRTGSGASAASVAAVPPVLVAAAAAILCVGLAGTLGWIVSADAPDHAAGEGRVAALDAIDHPSTGRVTVASLEALPPTAGRVRSSTGTPGFRVRVSTLELPQVPPVPTSDEDGGALVSGSLIDLDGNPLGGVIVVWGGDGAGNLGVTGADGTFHGEVRNLPATLVPAGSGLAPVVMPRVEQGDEDWHQWLVAAPSVHVAGWVVDADGVPVPGARVALAIDDEAFLALPILVDAQDLNTEEVEAGPDGAFRLTHLPTGPGLRLRTAHPGHGEDLRPVPAVSQVGLVVVLPRPSAGPEILAGVVLDRDGEPVAGASVAAGGTRVRTDGDGAFRLEVHGPRADARLVASKRGYRSAAVLPFADSEQPESRGLRLVLGGKPQAIEGRAVDAEGAPLPDWTVVAEPLLADVDAARDAEDDTGAFVRGETTADGGFRLVGLREGAWRVVAFDPGTLAATAEVTTLAGAHEVELHAAPESFHELAGRVVADGRPVANARVRVEPASATLAALAAPGAFSARTDAAGAFRFARVPSSGMRLAVEHPEVYGATVDLSQLPGGGEVEVPLERRRLLRIAGLEAAAVSFEDANGQPLRVTTPTRVTERASLFRGRSGLLAVPGSASALAIHREGEAVERRSLASAPEATFEVEP